jgi:hypothetical protein
MEDGSVDGTEVVDNQIEHTAEVQGPSIYPLPTVWPPERLYEEVPALSDLFPGACFGGIDSRSDQSELVR